jgi:hypothetical protein
VSYFDGSTGFGLVFQPAHHHSGFNKLGMWCAGNLGLQLHTTILVLINWRCGVQQIWVLDLHTTSLVLINWKDGVQNNWVWNQHTSTLVYISLGCGVQDKRISLKG